MTFNLKDQETIQKCKEMFDLNSKKLEVVDTYTHIGIERTSGVTVAGEIGEKAVKQLGERLTPLWMQVSMVTMVSTPKLVSDCGMFT